MQTRILGEHKTGRISSKHFLQRKLGKSKTWFCNESVTNFFAPLLEIRYQGKRIRLNQRRPCILASCLTFNSRSLTQLK